MRFLQSQRAPDDVRVGIAAEEVAERLVAAQFLIAEPVGAQRERDQEKAEHAQAR